ncbi:MAG: hypothetical protein IT271_05925 [Chitinophagales bacterium]|nr:hypothetical protein [Chitinophagales bacterium]
MSENQKEEQVITNNQSTQHNQSNQANQDNQKKSGDTSQAPPVIHESKIPTEVPKKHNVEEQERSHKTPVAEQEEEEENQQKNEEKEVSTPVANEKQHDTQDAK